MRISDYLRERAVLIEATEDCGLGISDCGLFAGTCRFDRSYDHGEDFVCFILQIHQQFLFHQSSFNNQLHPIHTFVALFLNNPHFGNEFESGASAACSAVVGTNRRSTPEKLLSYHIGRRFFGKASVRRITLKAKAFVLFLKTSVFMEVLYDAKKRCSIGNR